MNGVSLFEKEREGGGGYMVASGGLDYLWFGRKAACLLCAGGVGQKTRSSLLKKNRCQCLIV